MNKAIGRFFGQKYRWQVVCFVAGVLVGVMFANWFRSIVTVVFVAGVLLALYFIWVYFDKLKKQ
ncbi:hypothetical protein [Meiothermus sp.]|uniref:hypothetical protein n=1 Tax=Meiothermus sp. TaxID=1955249 RepID=UPI0021DDA5D1|nr:hypothetical protein [Meiothermus sp.]GIW33865.1 MAG: hypothetical protein KatS3mg072_1198 [Meiothermus sp.]